MWKKRGKKENSVTFMSVENNLDIKNIQLTSNQKKKLKRRKTPCHNKTKVKNVNKKINITNDVTPLKTNLKKANKILLAME